MALVAAHQTIRVVLRAPSSADPVGSALVGSLCVTAGLIVVTGQTRNVFSMIRNWKGRSVPSRPSNAPKVEGVFRGPGFVTARDNVPTAKMN